ncbi:MAG: class I SAM-dependent methyltransferase [Luteolibacter sp.]
MMLPPRPTTLAHAFATQALAPGDLAVDATCGNGHDTLHLARLVGPQGIVIAMDIQTSALEETRRRLELADLHDGRVCFVQGCHTTLGAHAADASAALIVFNLGYLPGGDHALTTEAGTTAAALDAATQALRPGGLLMVTCYPGHPAGAHEAEVVAAWMKVAAHRGARVASYAQPFTQNPAPILWLAAR